MSFNELRRLLLNFSQKTLTQTLRHLEADEFVFWHVVSPVPCIVRYQLTPLGESLLEARILHPTRCQQMRLWTVPMIPR
jgi:DNA-binding HxlR family transcriptional regulator